MRIDAFMCSVMAVRRINTEAGIGVFVHLFANLYQENRRTWVRLIESRVRSDGGGAENQHGGWRLLPITGHAG